MPEQFHGFEQRRTDALARDRGAQRPEGDARLEFEPLDQCSAQRRFDRVMGPVLEPVQDGGRGIEGGRSIRLRHGIRVDLDVVVRQEQE